MKKPNRLAYGTLAFNQTGDTAKPLLIVYSVLFGIFSLLASPTSGAASESNSPVRIRFVDSATGCALRPDLVQAQSFDSASAPRTWRRGDLPGTGSAILQLKQGQQTLSVSSSKYAPMSAQVDVTTTNASELDFYLDPLETPEQLRPDVVTALHREGATLMQGFVVDDDSREPLAGVHVSSLPSGAETETDARGFFRFYVPVQTRSEASNSPACLVFEKAGYSRQIRLNLELWSRGDWTYRVRLAPGAEDQIIDENSERRREIRQSSNAATPSSPTTPSPADLSDTGVGVSPNGTSPANASVRVPRNIRVKTSSGAIDYVTMDYYVKHVLPSEWIASWGAISGGSNSLNAGAVSIRCYAIAKINSPQSSTYDICGTSACQVYGTQTSSYTDRAVNYTADYVLINSSGIIPSTEYSAENNSLGYSCGDGYTQPTGGCLYDPVCSGEARYGHGRGLCQWGSARWATGRKMAGRTSGDTTPNGYPQQDWTWIVQHYYPDYVLVKGVPLVIGDDVVSAYDTTIYVNICADGGISSGVNCPLLASLPAGVSGVIVDGPQRITADGRGYTWYKVQYNDTSHTLGWTKENYLERIFFGPGAPAELAATPVSSSQINLSWSDPASVEAGFKIERANSSGGAWVQNQHRGCGRDQLSGRGFVSR